MGRGHSGKRPTVAVRKASRAQAINYLGQARAYVRLALQGEAQGNWDGTMLLAIRAGMNAADAALDAGSRGTDGGNTRSARSYHLMFPSRWCTITSPPAHKR